MADTGLPSLSDCSHAVQDDQGRVGIAAADDETVLPHLMPLLPGSVAPGSATDAQGVLSTACSETHRALPHVGANNTAANANQLSDARRAQEKAETMLAAAERRIAELEKQLVKARRAMKGEDAAATKVQCVVRGRSARLSTAGRRKQARAEMDFAREAAATKVQSMARGRRARAAAQQRGKEKVAATKVQAMTRGRNSRKLKHSAKQTNSRSILTILPGHAQREARKKIEVLLKREARQQDEVILAHRLVLARKDALTYLSRLHKEDQALAKWAAEGVVEKNLRFEAAMRIQQGWILRPWSKQAAEVLRQKLVQRRAHMRRALLDIEEFRDDIKTQVFDFFGQIAPPLVKRIAEVKKRVGEVNAKQVNDQSLKITSTNHPLFHSLRVNQQELLALQLRMKAIETKMLVFADRKMIRMIKREQQEDPLSEDDSPKSTRMTSKLSEMHKGSMSSMLEKNKWSKMRQGWKTVERRQMMMSTLGPGRKATTTAVEELHALREEMQRVTDTTDALARTRQLLARLRAGKSVNAIELYSAAPGRVPVVASGGAHAAAVDMMHAQNPTTRVGSIRHIAGATTTTPTVSLAHTIAAPLWVCSPSDGWHAQHAITQAAPSAGPSRPSTHHARSRMPSSVGERHHRQQNDGLSEAAGVVSLGSMKLATDGPMTGAKFGKHPVSSAYAQNFVIPTTYYDLASARWVTSHQKVSATPRAAANREPSYGGVRPSSRGAPAITPIGRNRKGNPMKSSQSLPTLVQR